MISVMPEACARMLGQPPTRPPPPLDPPPPPVTSATAPPIYQGPDPGGPLPTAAPPPGQSPELTKAKAAQAANDHKKVKAILGPKVKSGKATREEAMILLESCANLKDKACLEMVRKQHPEIAEGT